MNFLEKLNTDLNDYHLLKHDFYQRWTAGLLSQATLQTYAEQYYHHVAAFPQYISATHSWCADLSKRQILLGNLNEEEQGEDNHPELWMRFAEGLGCTREDVKAAPQLEATKALVDGYFGLTRSSYAAGLAALYAYERQTPAVSTSKIDGLKTFYGITDPRTLKFFAVHEEADEWHSDECAKLLESLDESEKEEAHQSALSAAKLLWQFLDGMEAVCKKESSQAASPCTQARVH